MVCHSRSSPPAPFQYRCSPPRLATRAGAWLETAPGTGRGPLQPRPSYAAHHSAWSGAAPRQARYNRPRHAASAGFSVDAAPNTRCCGDQIFPSRVCDHHSRVSPNEPRQAMNNATLHPTPGSGRSAHPCEATAPAHSFRKEAPSSPRTSAHSHGGGCGCWFIIASRALEVISLARGTAGAEPRGSYGHGASAGCKDTLRAHSRPLDSRPPSDLLTGCTAW